MKKKLVLQIVIIVSVLSSFSTLVIMALHNFPILCSTQLYVAFCQAFSSCSIYSHMFFFPDVFFLFSICSMSVKLSNHFLFIMHRTEFNYLFRMLCISVFFSHFPEDFLILVHIPFIWRTSFSLSPLFSYSPILSCIQ